MGHEGQKAALSLLHKAEEHGQSRPLTINEVGAYTLISGLKGLVLGMAGSTIFALLRGLTGDLAIKDIGLSFAGFAVTSFGWHLLGDMDDLKDGLRQYRNVETYAPPIDRPESEPPHPPIVVRPYQGEPYTIGNPELPALPGREEALQLTPPIVAEVLRATVEEYGGEWSRRKLMRLRIEGQQVTRGMYEELTTWLSKAGVLQQRRQGGFALPPDVQEFEDLRHYFPNLPGLGGLGGPGGNWEGREGPPSQSSQSPDRGVGTPSTLANRRRQRWLECGCDVEVYRGKKKLGGATC